MMFLCPVVSIVIYLSPQWKRYVEKFDQMEDEERREES